MLAPPALADRIVGVADGDTLTVLRDNAPYKVRLANIDAPEKKQAFGARSRQSLSALCYGKEATIRQHSHDRYGRVVATVYCDGVDVNRRQVELGMAWVYVKYNMDRSLPPVEMNARRGGQGLWADPDPVPPWLYRQFRKPQPARGSREGSETSSIPPKHRPLT